MEVFIGIAIKVLLGLGGVYVAGMYVAGIFGARNLKDAGDMSSSLLRNTVLTGAKVVNKTTDVSKGLFSGLTGRNFKGRSQGYIDRENLLQQHGNYNYFNNPNSELQYRLEEIEQQRNNLTYNCQQIQEQLPYLSPQEQYRYNIVLQNYQSELQALDQRERDIKYSQNQSSILNNPACMQAYSQAVVKDQNKTREIQKQLRLINPNLTDGQNLRYSRQIHDAFADQQDQVLLASQDTRLGYTSTKAGILARKTGLKVARAAHDVTNILGVASRTLINEKRKKEQNQEEEFFTNIEESPQEDTSIHLDNVYKQRPLEQPVINKTPKQPSNIQKNAQENIQKSVLDLEETTQKLETQHTDTTHINTSEPTPTQPKWEEPIKKRKIVEYTPTVIEEVSADTINKTVEDLSKIEKPKTTAW